VFDVREADFLQGAGAAAALLEVHLLERFGRDPLELGVAGTLLLGVESPGSTAFRRCTGRCSRPECPGC
jgi:hypothetical protein